MGALSVTRERALPRAVRAADPGRDLCLTGRSRRRSTRRGDRPKRRPSSPSRSRARAASGRCRRSSRRPSSGPARGPARCSSPTKCSAAWAAPGIPFYFPALGLTPDLISVGKALGSGVPIGAALVCRARSPHRFSPGDHGSTYGGNLLATRAALFVLEQLIGPAARWRNVAHRRRSHFETRAATRWRAEHAVDRGSARRRPDARARADDRRDAGDRRRADDAGCSSTARPRRSSACCRR